MDAAAGVAGLFELEAEQWKNECMGTFVAVVDELIEI